MNIIDKFWRTIHIGFLCKIWLHSWFTGLRFDNKLKWIGCKTCVYCLKSKDVIK